MRTEISAIDCAKLANDVYKNNLETVSGWRRVGERCWPRGFAAQAYEKGGRKVFAFRGTDDYKDVLQDALMVPDSYVIDEMSKACSLVNPVASICSVGFLTLKKVIKARANRIPEQQVRDAERYCNDLGSVNADLLVGHSLGGALALILGQRLGVRAISFNAPMLGGLLGVRPETSISLVHINSEYDPISRATAALGSLPLGREIKVPVSRPGFGLDRLTSKERFLSVLTHYHSIEVLLQAMELRRGVFDKDVSEIAVSL